MLKRKSPSIAGDETNTLVRYAPLRAPRDMPAQLSAFLDTVWEDNEFDQALIMLEGLVGRQHKVQPGHVRQLIALSLSPRSCLPDPTDKATLKGKTSSSKDAAAAASKSKAYLDAPSRDPFALTARKMRLGALRLLEDIAATNGPPVAFRAAPGYSPDPSLFPPTPPTEPTTNGKGGPPRESTPAPPQATITHGLPTPPAEDRSLDLDEDDKDFVSAGKRVGRCENIWDVLGGLARRQKGQPKGPTKERPVIRGGWDLLKTFAGAWEAEGETRRRAEESPVSPSFLRQFKTKDTGGRDLSQKALDVIFWPFDLFSPSDDEQRDLHHEDEEDQVDDDELDEGEKRQVAGRIVALIAELTITSKMDHSNVMREFVARLDRLPPSSVGQFFESLHSVPVAFTIRLCASYLEIKSHAAAPLASTSSLAPPSNASPSRRRTLNPSGSSSALLDSQSSTATSTGPSAPSHFSLPTPSSLLSYLSRLPTEVPSSAPSIDQSKAVGGGLRRPQGRKPTWESAARALKSHKIVKDVLVVAWCEASGEESSAVVSLLESGKLERVEREVQATAEEARKKMMGA